MIGAIAGLASSVINAFGQRGKERRQLEGQLQLQQNQFELNQKAAEADFERQKQFYSLQRDDQYKYNDPSAVRARYEAAGINPNAAFGVAGSYSPQQSPSGSVGSSSGVSGGSAVSFPFSNPLEEALKFAEIRRTNAETERIKGDTKDPEATKEGQRLQNESTRFDNALKNISIGSSMTDAEIKKVTLSQSQLNYEISKALEDVNIGISRQTLLNMQEEFKNLGAQRSLWSTLENLNNVNAKVALDQMRVNSARIGLMRALSHQAYAVGDSAALDVMIKSIKAENPDKLLELFKGEVRQQVADAKKAEFDAVIREVESEIRGEQWTYEKWERLAGMFEKAGSAVMDIAGAAGTIVTKGQSAKARSAQKAAKAYKQGQRFRGRH